MELFQTRKPRRFEPRPIYYDERKERLRRMERNVKRNPSMCDEDENSGRLYVAPIEKSVHLRRYAGHSGQSVWFFNPKILFFLLSVSAAIWLALS